MKGPNGEDRGLGGGGRRAREQWQKRFGANDVRGPIEVGKDRKLNLKSGAGLTREYDGAVRVEPSTYALLSYGGGIGDSVSIPFEGDDPWYAGETVTLSAQELSRFESGGSAAATDNGTARLQAGLYRMRVGLSVFQITANIQAYLRFGFFTTTQVEPLLELDGPWILPSRADNSASGIDPAISLVSMELTGNVQVIGASEIQVKIAQVPVSGSTSIDVGLYRSTVEYEKRIV